MRIKRLLALTTSLLVLVAAGCGSDDDSDSGSKATAPKSEAIKSNSANAKTTVVVGSKNFTEQKVLGEVYSQALEAAGYKVRKELNLGDEKTALKALEDGQISGYPEYTGTALLSFFNVPSDKLPKQPQEAYDQVKADFAKDGIEALPPTPFTSSNEIALKSSRAKELGVTKISDLKGKSQDLRFSGAPECRQRQDCLLGLKEVYGLGFKKFVPVDPALRHDVLSKDQVEVGIVYTTDPQIKRDKLTLLEDDKGMFPPYNSTFLVKQSFAEKAGPDMAKTIATVNKGLNADAMRELNARVDLDKETPEEAASAYLKDSGLVK